MNEIFNIFSNCNNNMLNNCCNTQNCEEKQKYKKCINSNNTPFILSSLELPCTLPKQIRKIIYLDGKIIETYLNNEFNLILKAIRTKNFANIIIPDGISIIIANFSTGLIEYSTITNTIPVQQLFNLLVAKNGSNKENVYNLKFLMNTEISSYPQLKKITSSFLSNVSMFGATFSAQTITNIYDKIYNTIDSYGIYGLVNQIY